mmetsp:Transcript_29250/g.98579  ORF Transcript_29250/g.98579 Transcript_29250/m.98579 type:complete len:393 (+) Transcript_29250:4354-5532(+)
MAESSKESGSAAAMASSNDAAFRSSLAFAGLAASSPCCEAAATRMRFAQTSATQVRLAAQSGRRKNSAAALVLRGGASKDTHWSRCESGRRTRRTNAAMHAWIAASSKSSHVRSRGTRASVNVEAKSESNCHAATVSESLATSRRPCKARAECLFWPTAVARAFATLRACGSRSRVPCSSPRFNKSIERASNDSACFAAANSQSAATHLGEASWSQSEAWRQSVATRDAAADRVSSATARSSNLPRRDSRVRHSRPCRSSTAQMAAEELKCSSSSFKHRKAESRSRLEDCAVWVVPSSSKSFSCSASGSASSSTMASSEGLTGLFTTARMMEIKVGTCISTLKPSLDAMARVSPTKPAIRDGRQFCTARSAAASCFRSPSSEMSETKGRAIM